MQVWVALEQEIFWGFSGPSPKKLLAPSPIDFRGKTGIRALYQAIGIPSLLWEWRVLRGPLYRIESENALGTLLQTRALLLDKISGRMGAGFLFSTVLRLIRLRPEGRDARGGTRLRGPEVLGPLRGLGIRPLVSAVRGPSFEGPLRPLERLSEAPERLFRGLGEVCSFSTERGNKVGHSEAPKGSRFPGCPLRGFQPLFSYPRAPTKVWHPRHRESRIPPTKSTG